LWVTALVTLLSAPTFGQEYRGRVQGSLTDETQLAVPGATVTLRNDATGVTVTRTSGPEGRYLFDYVDPGTYTLTSELSGFATVVQRNVLVQARGDVTVDVMMKVAGLAETVTVDAQPIAIQFNTSSKDLTLDQSLLEAIPNITRNPTQLAYLSPVVRNAGNKNETSPYHHWAGNDMDIGGGTRRRNDVLLDGTPLEAGPKVAYTPPMDAIAEFNVSTNAVDAEFGHSAGGIISMSLKSGTNAYHGTGYFVGRNPDWNAVTNRVSRQHSNNTYAQTGGTLGMPLRRNKVFLFTTVENSRVAEVLPRTLTMPTALERQGDFSQSFNRDGSLRVIYDPWTSRFAPDGRTIIRDPFPNNRIPAERWDPLAARLMGSLWAPNSPGDDRTGLNNFQYNQEFEFEYLNYSSRLDWNINDKWKTFARISRFQTDQGQPDFTGGVDSFKLRPAQGSKRNGWNIAADTVYTMSSSTAINVRAAYYQVEDKRDYPDMALAPEDYTNLWPNNWFQPYMDGRPILYFPEINMGNYGTYGVGSAWWQIPEGYSLHARFNKYLQNHSIKTGSEVRIKRGEAARFRFYNFVVNANSTANTPSSPNLAQVGHPWASFLLGALANNSSAQYVPMQKSDTEMYGFYVQDDYRLRENVTLNLGLRWEYEGGLFDPQYRLPREVDLTVPVAGLQAAIDPRIPADVKAIMAESAGQKSPIYNGAYYFTDEENPRNAKVSLGQFMPRLGMAWSVNRKTAVRLGYGRFYTPQMLVNENATMGQLDLGAFSPLTPILPEVQGVPQVRLSNPFPQGLSPAVGKRYGTNTGLGDNVRWDEYNQRPAISDRFSFSLQREVWGRTILDASYLMNFIRRDGYTKNFNLADPRLRFKYGAALDVAVPNPFFNYGTPDTFPGALRTRATVSRADLLRPYPQYLDMIQEWTNGRSARYHTMELRAQRPFFNGMSVLAGYAYVRGTRQEFYDIQDQYDGKWTWTDVQDPRHRLNLSVVWDVPVGRGKAFGTTMPDIVDAVVGNWEMSGNFRYESGEYLRFNGSNNGGMIAPTTTPKTIGEVGSGKFWFDTAGFATIPAFTRRTNPWQYDDLKGPNYKNVDLALSKRVPLRGTSRLNFRIEAYNLLNTMNWANPSTTIGASDFGQVLRQADAYFGRQLQYTLRIEF
jgi:hypothetical protein